MRPAGPQLDLHAMRQFIETSKAGARGSTLPPMRTINSYVDLYRPYEHPAMPPKAARMAMDSELVNWTNAQFAGTVFNAAAYEGLVFPGYAYLSELALRTEFRVISETIADDATRKWIDFEVTGDEEENKRRAQNDPEGEAERMADPDERKKRQAASGKMDKVKALKDDQERLGVRNAMYCVLRDDGFFGRAHLFLGIGTGLDGGNPEELAMPIGDGRNDMSIAKVGQGSFKSVKPIEAVWTYPMAYNAMNPLLPDWYDPQRWYVQGTEVHKSRMPLFISHPVPDLLKPAYSFGGISNSQLCQPYVDIWLQTRQSVAAIIKAFSVFVLKSNLSTLLQAGAATNLMTRVMMFNSLRDNQGCMVIDKDTEDFMNVSASLAGLHELQAQALEHIASASRIPLVKLTGIEPSGLNASSEGSLQCYDDTILAYQNRVVRPNLTSIVNFQQLSLWGEIDPEITIVFEKLREATPKERSDLQKADAERDEKYISMGALAPEEVRKRIIDEPELPYAGLDPDDVPDLETEEEAGLTFGKKPGEEGEGDKPGETGGKDAALPFDGRGLPVARTVQKSRGANRRTAMDAGFNESDHPRGQPGNPGQFGSGGVSSGESTGPKKAPKADISRAWENPKLLSKVIRKSKLEKSGDQFENSFDEFSEASGSWRYHAARAAQITEEDRAGLKEGEVFEDEEEAEEARQNVMINVDDVHSGLVGLFDKTGAILGVKEMDFGDQDFEDITLEQATAIDAAITRLDLRGEAGLIESSVDQLDTEVEYEEEGDPLIEAATEKLREKITKVNEGAKAALLKIKEIMSGKTEEAGGGAAR